MIPKLFCSRFALIYLLCPEHRLYGQHDMDDTWVGVDLDFASLYRFASLVSSIFVIFSTPFAAIVLVDGGSSLIAERFVFRNRSSTSQFPQ